MFWRVPPHQNPSEHLSGTCPLKSRQSILQRWALTRLASDKLSKNTQGNEISRNGDGLEAGVGRGAGRKHAAKFQKVRKSRTNYRLVKVPASPYALT